MNAKSTAWLLTVVMLGFASPRDIVITGEDVHVTTGMTVRNVVCVGGDALIEGRVERDAVVLGGDICLSGTVGQNAVVLGGHVKMDSAALVGRDVVVLFGRLQKDPNARIHGHVTRGLSRQRIVQHLKRVIMILFFLAVLGFFAFLVLSALVAALAAKPMLAVSQQVQNDPLKCLGWGLLAAVLIVPVALMLLVSVVGIVLIPVEIALVALGSAFGFMALGQLAGKRLLEALGRSGGALVWETVLGVVVLSIVFMIPVLGWLLKALAWFMALGGLVSAFLVYRKDFS